MTAAAPAGSRSSAPPSAANPIVGSTLPRQFTQPLVQGPPGPCGCGCALTPTTSLGFLFEQFCTEIVRRPLDPWQRWLGIHGLEQLPDGRPRFRQILVLVARQNGKTEMLVLLSLFWMYVQKVGLILGTSTKLDYARESWLKVVKLARSVADLQAEIGQVRNANGEQEISTILGSRYKIAASNEEGGRSLTVARLIEDELRQHRDWSAHDAAENAMNAEPGAQAWAISNAGDDRSVVLNALQEQALAYIATGAGDYRLGYFGWTGRDGCAITDVAALAAANPNLGIRIDAESLIGRAQRAELAGGEQEAGFRTEVLCQHVHRMKPEPIPVDVWVETARDIRPSGDPVFFITIAKEMASASIAVAAMNNGLPHVELAEHADGVAWLTTRVRELFGRYPSARFGAYSAGPVKSWLPQFAEFGLSLDMVSGTDAAAACAHLQRLCDDFAFTHSPDPVLVDSLKGAERRELDGGGWAWDWHRSTGDVAPIAGATGALWLLETSPPGNPGVYVF